VIASISGVDVALVVTEPTVSGVHDLERVLELTRHFGVRALICINKCDLNAQQAERIRELARRTDARVVGEIPFDEEVNEALMNGCILSECGTGPAARAIRALGGALRDEALRQGAPAGIR
jgi:MinD superfamily P-loop ATPase